MRKLIPVIVIILIVFYTFGWSGFFQSMMSPKISGFGGPSIIKDVYKISGGLVQISTGDAVSVGVTRAYLFGLIRLPVVIMNYDISGLHNMFFNSMYLMLIIYIALEVWNLKRGVKPTVKNDVELQIDSSKLKKEVEEMENPVTDDYENHEKEKWKRRGLWIGKGFLVLIGVGLLSGDGGAAVGTAFLYLYINYKLKKS